MMSAIRSFASSALAGAGLLLALGSANAVPVWPGVGTNSTGGSSGQNGPALIITVGVGGIATLSNGPSAGFAYDGVEDTYIGLVNNSGGAIGGVTLTGSGIFGFDGDGIGVGPYCTGNGCGTNQYGTANAQDPSGYGGPMGHFSVVDNNNGTFLLNSPLADGGFTWFSLEESPNVAGGLTIGGVVPGATPIPGALPLFATGGAFLGYLARRRRKGAAKA